MNKAFLAIKLNNAYLKDFCLMGDEIHAKSATWSLALNDSIVTADDTPEERARFKAWADQLGARVVKIEMTCTEEVI